MRLLSGALLLLGAAAVMAPAAAGGHDAVRQSHDQAFARNLDIFTSMAKELELRYVDSIRTDEAFQAAIAAMLSTVDPYTEYYSYEDRDRLMRMTTGSYAGIGSYIYTDGPYTYLSDPIDGSPAQKAGLMPGDRILMVDSVNARDKKTDEVSAMLKGVPGTTVRVTVRRPYPENPADSVMTFSVVRDKIQEKTVPWWGVVNDSTGYICLTAFVDKSGDEVRQAVEAFKANPEVKNVVLDLRGNGGGLVETAVDILSNFLPKGTEVLRTRGKTAASERVYKTRREPLLPDIPLVVLTDGGSASASEIVAGALQDLDRAVLVGSRSFGKGLVQGSVELPYSTMMKVTTAKYYIPSGRLIQALDYSRRNADGSVARTPDSLTNVYKTLHGREVRDGGGLTPDSTIDWGTNSALLFGLVTGHHIADFANRYRSRHKSIPRPQDFVITDTIYEEFVNFVDPSKVKYDRICNDMLKDLRDAAKNEGYLDPAVTAAIDSLDKLLTHDFRQDLRGKRKEIEKYLGDEIVGRYYGTPGKTRHALIKDKALEKAGEIFSTPGLYRRILRLDSADKRDNGRKASAKSGKENKK